MKKTLTIYKQMEVIAALLAGLTLTRNDINDYMYFDSATRTIKDSFGNSLEFSCIDLTKEWYEYTPSTTITLRTVIIQSTFDSAIYVKTTATSAYLDNMRDWTVVEELGVETINVKG